MPQDRTLVVTDWKNSAKLPTKLMTTAAHSAM
eukprot:CAMPEP_0170287618 /NCGR_PEP_ID=MMETSP0116_2-20130129/43867_1 /TAXON_ID=400756 /ORGANISM="Durinskia baltica, Strain CSIRO CS-38" /LENGTH=31 /DNA_ID= /DNA_START= /DNA_END= /DNA_ORIENTATION=